MEKRIREAALKSLYSNKRNLTRQQYKTLKGQIFAGDIPGYYKGVQNLLGKANQKTANKAIERG